MSAPTTIMDFPLVLSKHIPPRMQTVIEIDSNECWNWLGRTSRNGYGRVLVDGREVAAHRFFYQFMIESVGAKTQLDHKCRNRACVNPDHLERVTPTENNRRARAAKRGSKPGNSALSGTRALSSRNAR